MPMLVTESVLLAQEEEGPNPLLPHLSELIVGVVAFGILLYVLWKFVFPTFERTYAERTAAIEGGIKEAEEKQAEAQRALDQYRQQLATAREEAAQIRADAQRQGQEIIAEMREQAQAEADRITSRAQAQLAAEREQVIRSLRTEVGSLATELAGRVVGESLADDARSQRVVERFLADLESGNGADSPVGSSNGGS